jgi:hypothetical protein
MSRAISIKSLMLLGSLAAAGIAFAPGASAAPPGIHISPSMGHPVLFDLRDQIRYPKVPLPNLTDDTGTVIHGGHPPVHIIHRPK